MKLRELQEVVGILESVDDVGVRIRFEELVVEFTSHEAAKTRRMFSRYIGKKVALLHFTDAEGCPVFKIREVD